MQGISDGKGQAVSGQDSIGNNTESKKGIAMDREAPIRILHVLGNTNLGGAESRTMDLYRHMDRKRVQFDFLVHSGQEGHFDKEIHELGGHIYRVPRFRIYNYFSYVSTLKKFFSDHHEYKAVQGHMTSTASIYLPIAKKAGVPVTIAHARSAGVDKGIKGMATRWLRRSLPDKTDYMFTCSRLAGISVFGSRAVEEGKTVFMPNAIDCKKFDHDPGMRSKIREELGISSKYVIGHVGRFHYAKNHEYLLRVFAALCEKGGKEYVLLLLGEGEKMEEMKRLAKELQVEDRVYFAGNRSNVYDYYQAMDYFVYPSRYEGLPGTVLEAQTSGLRCLMSDSICEEVAVTKLVHTMGIETDPKRWADYIEKTEDYMRRSYLKEVSEAGFDVEAQAEKMMKFYETGKLI